MLVTALSPVIGQDKSSRIAHYALDNDKYNGSGLGGDVALMGI